MEREVGISIQSQGLTSALAGYFSHCGLFQNSAKFLDTYVKSLFIRLTSIFPVLMCLFVLIIFWLILKLLKRPDGRFFKMVNLYGAYLRKCIISFFLIMWYTVQNFKRHKKAYSGVKTKPLFFLWLLHVQFSFIGANILTHFLNIFLSFGWSLEAARIFYLLYFTMLCSSSNSY